MGKNKMIAKSCPKCELQVAVASKTCKCGHTFFSARRAADTLPAVEDIRRRRTGRVRRSQPQFYDAQHYQKQIKRRSPKKRSLSRSLDEDYKVKEKNESATARARARPHAGTQAGTTRAMQTHIAGDQQENYRRHVAASQLMGHFWHCRVTFWFWGNFVLFVKLEEFCKSGKLNRLL